MLPEAERYSCQLTLPGFGHSAQTRLERAKVLVVGVGGLGCPAAQYLAAAGVGTLAIADHDTVSMTNLHRQVLFADADIGRLKAEAAAEALRRHNPAIRVKSLPARITVENVSSIIKPYDIVVDCTDNFETRYLLNDACVLAGKPLVYGAAYQYQGQVAVWNVPNDDGTRSPHYRDIFPSADSGFSVDCTNGGVMPTLTGIIGCMQANETIKYLIGFPGLLAGRLVLFDVRTMQSQTVSLPAVSRTAIQSLPSAVPTISSRELKGALHKGQYSLIDVRTPDEHADFNIGGKVIPLERLVAEGICLDVKRPTVFYCATGKRSALAVRRLLRERPDAIVLSLEGGVAAWQQESVPA